MKKQQLLSLMTTVFVCLTAHAAPRIELVRQPLLNLFAAEGPVRLKAQLRAVPPGEHQFTVAVTNYFGQAVWERELPFTAVKGQPAAVDVDLGALDPGYYEIAVASGGASATASFGVATFVRRSAKEAKAGGYRFGLKTFEIGAPGVWWRRPLVWNVAEAADATVALGLNWTRHDVNRKPNLAEPGIMGTHDLTTKHDMNVVYKIEGIPPEAYDAQRYGPMETYKDRTKKSWSRTTVPLRDPYQAWLREIIAALPVDQTVFEIGNEVWNYMSMEEFAEWCQMVVPVVKTLRPDAVIGPDPGSVVRAKRFVKAGGMNGMTAYFIHPYSFTPMPEHRVRALMRNVGDFLELKTGRRFDAYVTEYGWPTAPKCSRGTSVSERTQAQRTTRQSLMLYAEDCKTLIPHMMADREETPTDWDDWFGFFRLSGEPKPVVVAHAVCARMIDGSRFVGDLDFGTGVGAMLFDRQGVRVLALWTMDEAPGTGRDLVIDVAADRVRVVDIMGRARDVATENGGLTLKVSSDVLYVEGVGAALAAKAVPPSGDLNPDRWTTRAGGGAVVVRATREHRADGDLAEWAGVAPTAMIRMEGDAEPDFTAEAMLAWDDADLHVAVRVMGAPSDDLGRFEMLLGTRPSRQLNMGGWGIYDFNVQIVPPDAGAASLTLVNSVWDAPIKDPVAHESSGIRWKVEVKPYGWIAETSIPRKLLHGFPVKGGDKALSGVLQWRSDSLRMASSRVDVKTTREWPYFELRD